MSATLVLATTLAAAPVAASTELNRERSPNQKAGSTAGDERALADGSTGNMTPPPRFPDAYRSVDGTGNNSEHPLWGSAGRRLLRLTRTDYADGVDAPSGASRVSARAISNACAAQSQDRPSQVGASDFLWQWGQFLDHDIDLTPTADPAEPFDIVVPAGDVWFDPAGTGTQTIGLDRSYHVMAAGARQQVNDITAFIDASNVYGSDTTRAQALRALDGTGRLAVGDGGMLPFNTAGLPNAPSTSAGYFLAGDFRANEQLGLTAMHTLFVREHNAWADTIRHNEPGLDGEAVYQKARAIVAGELQAITYREFLPLLLGPNALAPYQGFKTDVNPGISNEFATAAYRLGHSMLSSELARLGPDGQPIAAGNISLAGSFFNPNELIATGIDPILRGLAGQRSQEVDGLLIDEVRNFLFGPPGAGGFDLASLNIQRGRDHGLPSLNDARLDLGLPRHPSFASVNPDPAVQAGLASVYATVDDIDLWVGGLAEAHVSGALVGRTFFTILVDQFQRLRDGDAFWYQSYLPPDMIALVDSQTLATIIRRNTTIGAEIANDVFRVRPPLPNSVHGDFDGNGVADLVWRHDASGENAVWMMDGSSVVGGAFLPRLNDPDYRLVGIADFDRDGQSDLLWRHSRTGQNAVWLMDGTTVRSGVFLLSIDPGWDIAGTGDIDGDGQRDILWRDRRTGVTAAWLMQGTVIRSGLFLPSVVDRDWQLRAAADLNGDGKADLVWRHERSGTNAVWFMNGGVIASTALLPTVTGNGWNLVGCGDFNRDGQEDLVWSHGPSDTVAIWTMSGATVVSGETLPGASGQGWRLVGPR